MKSDMCIHLQRKNTHVNVHNEMKHISVLV